MSFFKQLSFSISLIGHFWQEKINSQIFRWNLFFIIFQLVVLSVKFNSLPPQIPLYYSLPWGEARLASASHIFLLPTLSIAILLINNCLAVFFLRSNQLLSRLLVTIALIFSAFSAISLFQIISLIT